MKKSIISVLAFLIMAGLSPSVFGESSTNLEFKLSDFLGLYEDVRRGRGDRDRYRRDRRDRRDGRDSWRLGSFRYVDKVKVSKFGSQRDAFRLRRHVRKLALAVSKNKIYIEDAYVVFGNGRSRTLYKLIGTLRKGEVIQVRLRDRFVRRLVIRATSPKLSGSRGKYTVYIK